MILVVVFCHCEPLHRRLKSLNLEGEEKQKKILKKRRSKKKKGSGDKNVSTDTGISSSAVVRHVDDLDHCESGNSRASPSEKVPIASPPSVISSLPSASQNAMAKKEDSLLTSASMFPCMECDKVLFFDCFDS